MNSSHITATGSLVCVGTGMRLSGQLTAIAKSHIEHADVVLGAVANGFSKQWLQSMARQYVCLAQYYGDGSSQGKSRDITYEEMVERIVAEVRAGKQVCAAFYGHPGIFACIAHKAIAKVRSLGFRAQMEPGISAEDCLVADLGLDPGATGLISMEATQYLIYRRNLDPTALLVLWQPGLVGDLSLKKFTTSFDHLRLLVEKLSGVYSKAHSVILYEAAVNIATAPRIEHLPLSQLPKAELKAITTLVIPPSETLVFDENYLSLLEKLSRGNNR